MVKSKHISRLKSEMKQRADPQATTVSSYELPEHREPVSSICIKRDIIVSLVAHAQHSEGGGRGFLGV